MQNIYEESRKPIPPWAKGTTTDYTVVGALLPTRDGRQTGNSVVTRVTSTEKGVRIHVATEAGNVVGPLSLREVESLYHSPEFYCERKDFPGNSGEAWNDFIIDEADEKMAEHENEEFKPQVCVPFMESSDPVNEGEVFVMGENNEPSWMPLPELVEYMCSLLPVPAEKFEEKNTSNPSNFFDSIVTGQGPVDKGPHILTKPASLPPIPSQVYWCSVEQTFYTYSGIDLGKNFYEAWLGRVQEFPHDRDDA